MGTRKAPTGAKHAACRHHEAYATAPAGWLCFSDAPSEDDVLGRMIWADEIETARAGHRAAWAAFQAEAVPTGVSGRDLRRGEPGIFVPVASAPRPMTAEERAESERASAATGAQWRAAMIRDPKTYGMTRQEAARLAAYGEAA
jgi:hypothetical protein